MDELRQQTRMERRERAKAAFSVSEGIAKEREGLVRELHDLRNVNKNMMDIKVLLNITNWQQDQMVIICTAHSWSIYSKLRRYFYENRS